jgi:hypothetical protein
MVRVVRKIRQLSQLLPGGAPGSNKQSLKSNIVQGCVNNEVTWYHAVCPEAAVAQQNASGKWQNITMILQMPAQHELQELQWEDVHRARQGVTLVTVTVTAYTDSPCLLQLHAAG